MDTDCTVQNLSTVREMKKRDSGLLGFLTLCHIRRKRERERKQAIVIAFAPMCELVKPHLK